MSPVLKNTDVHVTNSFLASGEFSPMLITFANSLDPDQDRLPLC